MPHCPYQVQRATHVEFTGILRLWNTNAHVNSLFQVLDGFSDLGPPPSAAYYRTRCNP